MTTLLKRKWPLIQYNIKQMWALGLLLGHNKHNSMFLGTWLAKGFVCMGKDKIGTIESFYMLKYIYTLAGFRMLFDLVRFTVFNRLSAIFICSNIKFSGVAMLYAVICGEAFSGYSWVGGAITNWKEIVGYLYSINKYYEEGFKLNHRHRKRLMVMSGVTYTRVSRAGMSFFFRLKEASVALQEGGSARSLMAAGVADTDVMASELNLPIVANDSSLFSLHFFAYIISLNMLKVKIQQLYFWKNVLRRTSKLKLKLILINFLNWLKDKPEYLDDFTKYNNYMVGRMYFDTSFIFPGINSFNLMGQDMEMYDIQMSTNYNESQSKYWK